MTKTLSITSGKGGVGKTTIVTNLAVELARKGQRVLILDGDFGMANVDIMFGVRPVRNLMHVIAGQAALADIITDVAPNISILPGGSGIYELRKLSDASKWGVLEGLAQLDKCFDVMLIDTAPGIDDHVLYLNAAAEEIVVVLTADPSSLADSYALIKVLSQRHKIHKFSVISNMVRDEAEGLRVFRRLSDVAGQFLFVGLNYRGFVPIDGDLQRATKQQQLVCRASPHSFSASKIREFAGQLSSPEATIEARGGLQFFWENAIGVA
jgi:flagellar biosynthesis protein FlhG